MEEIGRFPRHTNKYKHKPPIENKTQTLKENLIKTYNNTNEKIIHTGTKLRGLQDKLQKTFPGVNDFNRKLEKEYNTNKKDKDKKNWWEH